MKNKKIFLAALLPLTALAMTACGKKSNKATTNSKTRVTTTGSKTTTKATTTEAKFKKLSETEWKALFADSNFAKYQMDMCFTEGLLDSNSKMEEKLKLIIDGNKIKTEAITGLEGLEFNLDDLLKKSTKDVKGYDSKYDNLLKDYIRDTLLNYLGSVGDNGNYTVGSNFTAAIPSYYEINQDGTLYSYEMLDSNGYKKELTSNSGTGSIASFIELFKPAKDFYSKVTFNEKTGEYSFKASDILSAYTDDVKDMVTGGTVTYKINNNKISSVVFDLTVSENTFMKITQDFTYENKSVTLPNYYLLSAEDSFYGADVYSNTDTCYLYNICSIGLLKHDYNDNGYCKVCGGIDNDTLEIVKVPELEAIAGDFFTVYKDKYGDFVEIDYDYGKEEYVGYIYLSEISKSLNIRKATIGDKTIYFGDPSSVHYTDGCTQGYKYTLYMLEYDGENYDISYSIDYKSKYGGHKYGFTVTPIDDTCTATVHGKCLECGQECEFVIEYHNVKTLKSEVGPFYKNVQTCENCGLTNTYYVFDYDKEDDVEYVLNYKDGKYSGYMYEKEKPDVHYDIVGIDYVSSYSAESNFTAIFKVEDGLSYVEFSMNHDDDENGYCKHCGTFMQYRYLGIPEPGYQIFSLTYNADNEIVDYYISIYQSDYKSITSGDYTIETTTYGNITEGEGNVGAKVTKKYLTADNDKCIYNSDITIEYYLDGELVDTVSYTDEGYYMYHSYIEPEIICEFELDLIFTSFNIIISKCDTCEEIFVEIV